MRKGFTLVELLIVMVVVGILVTVALPKYRTSLLRGRALEGINNLRAASEAVNARYVLNEGSYIGSYPLTQQGVLIGDFTKSKTFFTPQIKRDAENEEIITATEVDLVATSNADGYTLTAHNVRGEMQYISCTNSNADFDACVNIGMELDSSDNLYKLK